MALPERVTIGTDRGHVATVRQVSAQVTAALTMIVVSDYDVPARLIDLKKEFISLERGGPEPGGPEWTRMQGIALEIHRDAWWQEVDNAMKARQAMSKAARAALDGE